MMDGKRHLRRSHTSHHPHSKQHKMYVVRSSLPSSASSDSIHLLEDEGNHKLDVNHQGDTDTHKHTGMLRLRTIRVLQRRRWWPRRLRSLEKHHILLDNDNDDEEDACADTTALLSEEDDEHSWTTGTLPTCDDPWPIAVKGAAHIVHPHENLAIRSSHGRIGSLQQWKARMGRSFHRRIRLLLAKRQYTCNSNDDDDNEEEEVSFDHAAVSALKSNKVGLYAYPHDAVEAVYQNLTPYSVWDVDEDDDDDDEKSNNLVLTEVDPAEDPSTMTRKQSFVVSFDEWDCAQLVLQDEMVNHDDDNGEEDIEEDSLFLHLPTSNEEEGGQGVEVKYDAAFRGGYLHSDSLESSQEEDLFLNPLPNQGFEVIRNARNGMRVWEPLPTSDDPSLQVLSSPASSFGGDSPPVLNRRQGLVQRPVLGAKYSHPGQMQLQIQTSSSNEENQLPLGISTGHPSWVTSHKRRSATLDEASHVWSQVTSPALDGNVTDPPSPTKIETCETRWSQGLAWSASLSDDESDLTVSDVGFTENLNCLYTGGPRPIASFVLKPRTENGSLPKDDCPSDEDEESITFEPSGSHSRFACSPDVVEDLWMSSRFYHQEKRQKEQRPQCNCIKCSVTSMYANLGM